MAAGDSVTLADDGGFRLESELGRFDAWVGEMLEGVEEETQPQVIRAYGLEFTGRVMEKTPVDRGRARAGWSALFEEEGVEWEAKGSGEGGAVQQGKEEADLNDGRDETPAWVEIVNGVPYIRPLEHGHSDQAPAGMVRITLREMTADSELSTLELKALEAAIRRADRKAGW